MVMSEALKEIRFMHNIMKSLEISVTLPVVIRLWRKMLLPACELGKLIQDTILFVSTLRMGLLRLSL